MPKTLVTIGLCVKNVESTIEAAIESVIAQNYPRESMEVVVVDGCSKDRTVPILKENLSGTGLKTLFFSENKGLGAARQLVVENASGDYILWVDGDMRLTREYLKKHVDFMESNPSAAIAKGRYGIQNERNLVAFLQNVDYVAKAISWWGTTYKEKTTTKPIGSSGSICRVVSFRQIGGFNSSFKGGYEDTDVERRIYDAGWLIYSTDVVFFEQHRKSWKSLWDDYFWWGYGAHQVNHANGDVFRPPFPRLYAMLPPAGFVAGLWRSIIAYKIFRKKKVFLMPIHYTYKRIAWCVGFMKSHIDGYGHAH